MKEDIRTRTYEELLMNRITRCFEAMDAGSEEVFDEVLDQLEMLFKLQPNLYNVFIEEKMRFQAATTQSYKESALKIDMMTDDYDKDIMRKSHGAIIEWSYRKDVLETVLNILNQNQLIPMTNPVYADIETREIKPVEQKVEQPASVPPSQPSTPPPIIQQPPPVIQQPPVVQPPPIVEERKTIQPANVQPPPPVDDVEGDVSQEIERLKREEEEINKLAQKPNPPLKQ